ncbi:MAG: hypothetical protein KF915_20710 [Polyangiaceae bacterium]|nr:hypothetical protein [Polyangiaceae bacterium]
MEFFRDAPGMVLTLLLFELLFVLVLLGRRRRAEPRGLPFKGAVSSARREPLGFHERLGVRL